MSTGTAVTSPFIPTDALLAHWQGHRKLTRRVIEAFPEEELFRFRIGPMRTFGDMARELLGMAAPLVRGIATGEWAPYSSAEASTREELLRLWDESTEEIDTYWAQIPAERFQEMHTAFNMYTDKVYGLILYAIDNEIHHRGQGYVYLRALNVEPPPFWDRP